MKVTLTPTISVDLPVKSNDLIIEGRATQIAEKKLVGRRIKEVRYMTKEEAGDMYWSKRPLVIVFDNGSYMFASADDEGNNGGALFMDQDEVFPTL
jgi:hypothetical protein